MTEGEWLTSTDPTKMLEFLRGRASERKLRLFAVACCRRIRVPKDDAASHEAVEVAERFADGLASESERRAARESTREHYICRGSNWEFLRFHTRSAASFACHEMNHLHEAAVHAQGAIISSGSSTIKIHVRLESERVAQCRLIRDIFGNPFRPSAIELTRLAWNDGNIPRIASAIYDERAFDRMPELADALDDAGCEDLEILQHCCSRSGHVRGCWVLDALLGRS